MKQWTEHFRGAALKRIKEQEAFLDACGIMPVTGIEQEFYVVVPNSFDPSVLQKESFEHGFINEQWEQSPFVESVKLEVPNRHLYEIVIGRGSKTRVKLDSETGQQRHIGERDCPHPALNASSITRAANSVRHSMQLHAPHYIDNPKASIDFDGSQVAEPNTALQCNISLWSKDSGKPLFRNYAPGNYKDITSTNMLTQICAESLLNAQKAMPALVITSPHALKRTLHELGMGFENRTYGIGRTFKSLGQTISLRDSAFDATDERHHLPSLYFENEMAGGGEEPAFAMLVTVGGIVDGVKKYMVKHHLHTPQAMRNYIAHNKIDQPMNFRFTQSNEALPDSLRQAFFDTEKSEMAKEIMGSNFHQAYCNAYKQKLFGNSSHNQER